MRRAAGTLRFASHVLKIHQAVGNRGTGRRRHNRRLVIATRPAPPLHLLRFTTSSLTRQLRQESSGSQQCTGVTAWQFGVRRQAPRPQRRRRRYNLRTKWRGTDRVHLIVIYQPGIVNITVMESWPVEPPASKDFLANGERGH